MKLKTTEINGTVYAEVQDGKPVYEAEDGKLIPFDAPGTIDTINRRGAEAKNHRLAREQAEAALKAFEGLDAEAARKAIDIVGNLDAKKLIDAGEVEKVKTEAKAAFDRQVEAIKKEYAPVIQERDTLKSRLDHERLSVAFRDSKFIPDKLSVPVSFAQAKYGPRFYFDEDGKLRAKGPDGNPLFSRTSAGNPADFEEALELLVDSDPDRDSVLKGTGATGSGAGNSRVRSDGRRVVSRAEFDAMSPAAKAKAAREAEITD